jgi:16S rRNA (guanine(966)-N(2))-methyltransferase RsmD
MRVIAGEARGRPLRAVRGPGVRPTADRVREALFSIVLSRVSLVGSAVLDLFAGTGAVGIEALSRGAARAVFVERDIVARRVLRANLSTCRFAARAEIVPMSVQRGLAMLAARKDRFDGVFVDPPYGRGLAAETVAALAEKAILGPGAWVMVEHHRDDPLASAYGGLRLTQARRYGKTCLTLYRLEHTQPSADGAR